VKRLLVLTLLVLGLGCGVAAAQSAHLGAHGRTAYAPDPLTVVSVDGDRSDGWQLTRYDGTVRSYDGDDAALKACTTLRRMPARVRCSTAVNTRDRDFAVMQQALLYAYATVS
jgi:hypothetical protein